jgi:hypothetical protein
MQVNLTTTSWTWTADGVDYTATGPVNLPPSSPGSEQNYVLCVYDGMVAGLVTEFVTPAGPGKYGYSSAATICCMVPVDICDVAAASSLSGRHIFLSVHRQSQQCLALP